MAPSVALAAHDGDARSWNRPPFALAQRVVPAGGEVVPLFDRAIGPGDADALASVVRRTAEPEQDARIVGRGVAAVGAAAARELRRPIAQQHRASAEEVALARPRRRADQPQPEPGGAVGGVVAQAGGSDH